MTKLTLISAVGIALSCSALAHEGHEHATGVVRERMELMTDMGQRLLAISKRLRANKDLESITNDARAIRELASKITPYSRRVVRNFLRLQSRQFGTSGTTSPLKPKAWRQKPKSL